MAEESKLTSVAALSTLYEYQDTVLNLTAPNNTATPFGTDPKRLSLILSNAGPDNILVFFRPIQNTQAALIVPPNVRPTVMTFRDYGPIIQQPIGLTTSGTAGNATVNVFVMSKTQG